MNSMEFNKIAGATIAALLVFLLLNFFSGLIYGTREVAEHIIDEEHPGPVLAFAVPVEAEGGAAEVEEEIVDLHALFQTADAAAGESVFRACGACHAVEPGVNKVGPWLYGVVGRDVAAVEDFAYSDAMAAVEGDWTPEHLFQFLENPKGVIPGTKMSYAGLEDPADRANLIAYLNTVGDAPVDLTAGLEPLEVVADEPVAAAEVEAPAEAAAEESQAPVTPAEAAPMPLAGPGGTGAAGGVSHGETPAQAAAPGQAVTGVAPEAREGTEVVDIDTVQLEEENVGVESVVPLELEENEPAPMGVLAVDPVERALTEETPAEAHVTEEGPSDAPALPTGEDVTIEPEAAAPVPAGPAGEEVAVATPTAGLPAGDAAAGESLFRRCQACHKIEEGRHGIGPSLFGVVGRDIAAVDGFSYSEALAAQQGTWTPEELSAFLENPKAHTPGTKMAFGGLKDEQDRIDLITYLLEAAN